MTKITQGIVRGFQIFQPPFWKFAKKTHRKYYDGYKTSRVLRVEKQPTKNLVPPNEPP